MLIIQATQGMEVGGSWTKTSPGISMRPYLKKNLKLKGLGVGSVVELLSHKLKALNSNPTTTTKKKKKKKE
jgi:hypothetical protein